MVMEDFWKDLSCSARISHGCTNDEYPFFMTNVSFVAICMLIRIIRAVIRVLIRIVIHEALIRMGSNSYGNPGVIIRIVIHAGSHILR
jgi:hypothetical protein